MTNFLLGSIIASSVILIILIALQGAKADSASSTIMGGYQDTKLFAETKERGIDLFFTRATTLMTLLFFIFIVLFWML